jgi:hypothetical protein
MPSPYLTAARFNAVAGMGIDASFLTGPQLRANLQRATTMVDAFTAQAQVPQRFDFRGGTVTGEQHRFQPPNPLVAYAGSRRVFPHQLPLRTCTAFRLDFTNNYSITINPATDVYVNVTEGWIEIVASQPTIIGYPPIGYWYGLYQPVATISYTYGYRNAVTDDVLEAASPTLFYGTFGQWDSTGTTVSLDGVVQTTGYTVNAADGSVNFTAAPAPGVEVTASYTALLPPAVEQATAIIATDLIGKARNTQRMPGLSSMKVAEITLTRLTGDRGRYVTQNGVSIPEDAAVLLGSVNRGKAA